MTSDNQPNPDPQAGGEPAQDEAPGGAGNAASSEPSMGDLLDAMRSQQEATSKGFADLTSGLGQFLEKMAAVAAPAAQPPTQESPASDPPSASAEPAAPAPGEVASAETSAVADAAPKAPQPTAPQEQPAPVQPVTPPPVDPVAYGQTVPAAGFPQASQAVPQAGFPAPEQPQAVPQAGFPVMQDPQAPVPQAPVPQTPVAPVAQAAPVAAPVPQATSGGPNLQQPIRAARDMLRGRRAAPAQVGPPAAQQQPQQPVLDDRWKRILFGPDIANNQALEVLRDRVTEGLLGGDQNATGLAGTILIFNSASSDRMPQILKDVGEAYYRWNPRSAQGEDPLRNALITWLHRKCEAAGVSNTIVVVRPGDRFEAARHNSKQRGVEVMQVGGWVVLRDNGKVYTKANVAVR